MNPPKTKKCLESKGGSVWLPSFDSGLGPGIFWWALVFQGHIGLAIHFHPLFLLLLFAFYTWAENILTDQWCRK